MMERRYTVHYAADTKKAFPNLPVGTVGSITKITDAEQIIATGQADFVAMCRPLLADPGMLRKYALLTLCERGHDVTLYEKADDQLGGFIVPGAAHSFKQDMKGYLKYLVCQPNKAPARILLNTPVTTELLGAYGTTRL